MTAALEEKTRRAFGMKKKQYAKKTETNKQTNKQTNKHTNNPPPHKQ